jgi:hypothetical protein
LPEIWRIWHLCNAALDGLAGGGSGLDPVGGRQVFVLPGALGAKAGFDLIDAADGQKDAGGDARTFFTGFFEFSGNVCVRQETGVIPRPAWRAMKIW